MRSPLPLAGLILGLSMMPAISGAQVNMAWDDTGPGLRMFEMFDCQTSDGVHTLVASFRAPQGATKLVRLEAVVDFCSGDEPYPDWWDFSGCRAGAVQASTDFSAGPSYFEDYWMGRGSPTVTYVRRNENTGRLVVDINLPESEAGPLVPDQQYYAFRLLIDNRSTTGCGGCGTGVCLVLNDVRLIWPEGEQRLNGPGWMNGVAWQYGVPGCPFIVPVTASSWGAVKALHR